MYLYKNLDVPRSASFTVWKCFSSFNVDYKLGARGLRWEGWGGAQVRGGCCSCFICGSLRESNKRLRSELWGTFVYCKSYIDFFLACLLKIIFHVFCHLDILSLGVLLQAGPASTESVGQEGNTGRTFLFSIILFNPYRFL